jgi:hypothetical protein
MPKKQSKNKARQNNQRKSKGRKMSSRRGNSKNKKNRSKLSYKKRPTKGGGNYVQPPPPPPQFWKQLKNKDNQDQWIEHINEFEPSVKSQHIKLFFGVYLNSALKSIYNRVDLEGIKQTIDKIIEKIEGVSDDPELKPILDIAIEKINGKIQRRLEMIESFETRSMQNKIREPESAYNRDQRAHVQRKNKEYKEWKQEQAKRQQTRKTGFSIS